MRASTRLRSALWWLALAVFVLCAAWIGMYLYQSHAQARSLGALSGEVALLRAATPEPAAPQQGRDAPGSEALLDGYQALNARNRDFAGWIYIEGTAVDYPVMHTPAEPEKYLHRDFEGRYSFAGLPFLDALCDPALASVNQIVYAHNMRSGQMFAALKQYLSEDFLAEHAAVRFDTLSAAREYEVIAVLKIRATARQDDNMRCYQPFSTLDEDAVADFNDYLGQYAVLRAGEVRLGDDLLTLSTCERSGGADRLVVVARAPLPQS